MLAGKTVSPVAPIMVGGRLHRADFLPQRKTGVPYPQGLALKRQPRELLQDVLKTLQAGPYRSGKSFRRASAAKLFHDWHMSNSLLDFIQQHKPRRVLFSTYTFSPSWFETFLLPTLRRANCEQIDVLVDAREACKSTDEVCGLYAGRAYRVIPVFMEHTHVFHPKIAYLVGDGDADHLVVSSGNLTHSGHGRQLEVIDAVSSAQEPAVFSEFRTFLALLRADRAFSVESLTALRRFEERAAWVAQRAAPQDPEARRCWLLHTLVEPANTQFEALARRVFGETLPQTTLTVLSPFHTPTGGPIQALASKLGVQKLRIGLDGPTRVAPFADGTQFAQPTEYLVPDGKHGERPLHAKYFELSAPAGVLGLSGSVNATIQSFASTRNVEISLARVLPRTPFTWTTVSPHRFAPNQFDLDKLLTNAAAVQASWLVSSKLVGRVIPALDATASLEVWEGDECRWSSTDVQVVDGAFSTYAELPGDLETALRVVLKADGFEASGWINVEIELSSTDKQRKLSRSVQRLLAGTSSSQDVEALAQWLQDEYEAELSEQTSQAPSAEASAISAANTPAIRLSYEQWRRLVEMQPVGQTPAPLAARALQSLSVLLNKGFERKGRASDADTPLALIEEEGEESAARKRKEAGAEPDQALSDAEQAQKVLNLLPTKLARNAKGLSVIGIVEISAKAMLRQVRRSGLSTPQLAETSMGVLQGWMNTFSDFDYSPAAREGLLPLFCGLACVARKFSSTISLPSLREAIDRLIERALEPNELHRAAALSIQSAVFELFELDDLEDALQYAAALEASPSQTQVLLDVVLACLDKNRLTRPGLPPDLGQTCLALWKNRKRNDVTFGVFGKGSRLACPCCNVRLSSSAVSELRTRRALLCVNSFCQKPIFYGLPTAELAKAGLNGRFRG